MSPPAERSLHFISDPTALMAAIHFLQKQIELPSSLLYKR
jgi:hypothetical protein